MTAWRPDYWHDLDGDSLFAVASYRLCATLGIACCLVVAALLVGALLVFAAAAVLS